MNKKQTAETPEGMIVLGKNGEIDVEKTRLLQMQDLERRQTAAAERVAEMTARLASVIEDVGEIFREQFDRIVEKLEPIAMMFGDDDDAAADADDACDNDCEHCDWVTCPKEEAADGQKDNL